MEGDVPAHRRPAGALLFQRQRRRAAAARGALSDRMPALRMVAGPVSADDAEAGLSRVPGWGRFSRGNVRALMAGLSPSLAYARLTRFLSTIAMRIKMNASSRMA